MAKVILEDLSGSVPVTVFAGLLEKISSWFAPGRAVLVTGIVRSDAAPGSAEPDAEGAGGPVQIIARDIQPLEGMREAAARELVLRVALPETLDDVFSSVKELLESAPGNVPVTFSIRRPGQFEARVQLARQLAIRPTPELTEGLERLLGHDAIHYRYGVP